MNKPPPSTIPPSAAVPSSAVERKDTDERTVRKYEELFALAKSAWDADIARLDAAESKASWLVALPTFVVGLVGAGFGHFNEAFKAPTPIAVIFVASFLVVAILNGFAFWCFSRALTVSKVMMLPL